MVAKRAGGDGDVAVPGICKKLPGVNGLELGKHIGIAIDQLRDAPQHACAFGRRQAVPATRGERQPRRCDCGFDLGKPADGELTDRGPVRRIDAGRSQRRLVPDTTN